MFPIDDNKDRSENSLAGTVIEETITHPTEYDFFLQTQAGLQGTSRPTHYHVIHDDNKISSDELQGLTFNLAHMAGRATRTIGIASPSYFAHHLADKAKVLLEGDFSDSASASSVEVVPKMMNIVQTMKNEMYFM